LGGKKGSIERRTTLKRRYLTPKEVEGTYGFKVGTLANWRSQKKGPPYSKIGHVIRYNVEDIERWLKDFVIKTLGSRR
jgi:hypothetical protein